MKRILVIDDEPVVARLVGAALAQAGVAHNVDYCNDGGQGRLKAVATRYDLIVLDIAMPLMGGVEALSEIKHDARSAETPVVVLTGLGDPLLQRTVLDLGAAALIRKPVQAQELGALLDRLLSTQPDDLRPLGPGPASAAG
jgi:DNA-binding response OmpR family regulator